MKRKLLILLMVCGLLLTAAIPVYAGVDSGGYKDSGLYRMYYCYKTNTGSWVQAWALINGAGELRAETRYGYSAQANSPSVLKVLIKSYDWGFKVYY